jgi:formylglycine-generating enzyme required for sulfatase activity
MMYKEVGVKITTGDSRVLRGGSWIDNARDARSAYRDHSDPSDHGIINGNIGFRLARGPKGGRPAGESE